MALSVKTKFDGQTYNIGDTLPDLGSIRCVSSEGDIRHYQGNHGDAGKLPHYNSGLATGSDCLMENGDYYTYNRVKDAWTKM